MSPAKSGARVRAVRAQAAADGIVIVGAGQAGGRAAEYLHVEGFTGRITLIGNETERPYERPSLSKEMLLDHSCETIAWLHDASHYADIAVDLRLGIHAERIDREARQVRLSNGETLGYGALLLTTGARPRRLALPGGEGAIHYIRTLEDSRALRARLAPDMDVVVIGAGFIGLEVAAAARALGCRTTVVELGALPLGRVAPPVIQQYYRDLHEEHGVSFRFEASVLEVTTGPDGRQLLRLSTGETLAADLIVAGVGALANADLARESGLACNRGILVDEFGQSEDPAVFAAGDVAEHYNPILERPVLLESWQNAQNQAIAVARNLARDDDPAPYAEWPWFWSDQYDANLQVYGLPEPEAETLIRGDPAKPGWIAMQMRDGRLAFAAGVNAARDLRAAREIMKLGLPVDPAMLVDETIALPALMRALRSGTTVS